MCLEVLGIGNEELGIDDGARDFVARLPVCFLWRAARFVLTPLYWLNLALTSLSDVLKFLLQVIYELPKRPVGSISDPIPLERPYVVVGRL